LISLRIIRNHVKTNRTFPHGRVIHDAILQIIGFVNSSLNSYKFCHNPAISIAFQNGLQVGKWEPWKPAYSEMPQNPLPALHLLKMQFDLQAEQANKK
jgi:hypothetical protein